MSNWTSLQPADMLVLLELYNEAGRQSDEFLAACDAAGVAPDTAGRYCRFINSHSELFDELEMLPNTPYFDEEHKNLIRLPTYVPRARLTDIEVLDADSDTMKWVTWLADKAISTNKEIQVMHLCDIHAPFQDKQAVDLAFQMMDEAQPDIVVVGSDFADLYLSTHFDVDPDLAQYDDELDCFEEHWNPLINRIQETAPNAINLFIWGNHEQRLIRKLWKDAKQYRKRVLRDFRDIVKNNGAVWYLGDNVKHVRIAPLQVEHGSRHNEHLVKARLIDEGAQVSLMMGHVHKRNFYEIQGADYSVNGISSGCLCPTNPHYAFGTAQSGRKWVQGTAVASFSLDEREVYFENIKFENVGTKKVARFRGKRFETSNLAKGK